ncbi:hypothetical protein IG631_01088 [Alternaria alternata]|nr:hypothetical protein IG631_01088 [Alternaria alternata]
MLYDYYPCLESCTLSDWRVPPASVSMRFSMTLSAPLNGLERPSAANAHGSAFVTPQGCVCPCAIMADTVDGHGMRRITPRILQLAAQVLWAGRRPSSGLCTCRHALPTSFHFTCREQSCPTDS